MAKRKIAVLTINFNTEHLIERFINSIRVQSYDNWFLIIANNSVTDDILQKVKAKFPDLEIHILNINENIGYSKANNFSFTYLIKNFALDKSDILNFKFTFNLKSFNLFLRRRRPSNIGLTCEALSWHAFCACLDNLTFTLTQKA